MLSFVRVSLLTITSVFALLSLSVLTPALATAKPQAPAAKVLRAQASAVSASRAKISFRVYPAGTKCNFRPGAVIHVRVGARVKLVCRRAPGMFLWVKDTSAPVFSSAAASFPSAGALTLVDVPGAVDAVNGAVKARCTVAGRALPSLFALGSYEAACTARDRSGNRSQIKYRFQVVHASVFGDSDDDDDAADTGSDGGSGGGTTADPAPIPDPDPTPPDPGPTTPAPVVHVLDADIGDVGSDPVMLPAPNDHVGWKLLGAPASSVTQDGASYGYAAAGWRLDGAGRIGRLKENITVTHRQGLRTWTWQLLRGADDAAPTLGSDGRVHLGAGVVIDQPLLTRPDASALSLPVAWQLAGNMLSLTFDDASLPLPYVIDPTTTYPSIAFTGGPANMAMQTPGVKTWTFDVADNGNPITEVECHVDGIAINRCTLASRSYTSAYLMEGYHTLDVYARTSAGRAWARRVIMIDGTGPNFPANLEHDSYQTPPAYLAGESAPSCVHSWEVPAKPEFSMNWLGTSDLFTTVVGYQVLDNAVEVAALPGSAYGYHFSGLAEGPHMLRVEATNGAGITTAKTLQVFVDTVQPTLDESVFTMGSSSFKPPGSITFELPGADDQCLRSYILYITGRPMIVLSGWRTQYTVNLPAGSYSWRVIPFDAAGNSPATLMQWRSLFVL